MKSKNTLALLLAGAMLFPANALAVSPSDFSDFPSNWSTAALTEAVNHGLLSGYGDEIRPNGALTAAELAAIMNRAFGASETASLSVYTDVLSSDWFYADMAKAVRMGLFIGADGKLTPNGPISRERAFTVLARAFGLESNSTSVLNSFSDRDSVSSWAASSIAALVENGYVSGADGKINAQKSITRAEFAKVISGLCAHYIDADGTDSKQLEGNVVVRANGVSLNGVTINGDLILADGVRNISLDGVTVTGRIIVRGGADGVKIASSSAAKGVLVNNPNATVSLSATDSKLDTVTAKTNVSVAGTLQNMVASGNVTVQKGAQVDNLVAAADGVTVSGEGKVLAVKANASNVTVTNQGAKVTAGANTSGVKAGSKAVDAGKTETVGAATSSGGSSSGGSSSGGSSSGGSSGGGSSSGGSSGGGSSSGGSSSGGSSSGGQVTSGTMVEVPSDVIATDAGTWLPLVYKDGYNKDNTTITVDGKDVSAYVTNVITEGTVAKLPLTSKPNRVTINSADGKLTQSFTLGGTASDDAVYTGSGYLPDYYLAHGPVALWDYYLTNYDANGNVRILPEQTTFATAPAQNKHPSYAPDLILDEEGQGSVVIMFNYTEDADKQWFDNIESEGALQLVSYDQYRNVWNANLTFEKGTASHNSSTVGTLTIPFGQSNFTNNQRYYVRVCSTSADGVKSYALVPIHVKQNAVPSMKISETPESGRNLHFEVSNLVYGITNPIEKVTLTDPTGTKTVLDNIDDYFLFSQDLFVLYNDVEAENGENHLRYKGEYTLVIEANGFQTFSTTFRVNNGEEPVSAVSTYRMDAVSRATASGSTGSSSSDSTGSLAISADLLFDSDLLANALVLESLNQETDAASVVLDYWKSNTVADAVFHVGDTQYYAIADYLDAINGSGLTKDVLWKPFADYRAGAEATFNPPHATKAILQDGLLGEIQDASLSGKLDAPTCTVSDNQEGKDAVLHFDGAADYLNHITALYLNGDWRELSTDYFTIDAEQGTITLNAKALKVGDNVLKLQSAGYKPQEITISYAKAQENITGLTVTQNTAKDPVHIVIGGSEGDFLQHLTSVTLTDENGKEDAVYHKGYEGSDAVYYVIAADNKSMDLYNVKPGTYTVTIAAQYYNAQTAPFTAKGEVVVAEVPAMTITSGAQGGVYRVDFNSNENATTPDIRNWKYKVTSIKVNGQAYSEAGWFDHITSDSTLYQWDNVSNDFLQLGGAAFTADANTVVIEAEGYQPLTIQVAKEVVLHPAPTDLTASAALADDQYQITLQGDTLNADWWNAVQSVTENGEAVSITKGKDYTFTAALTVGTHTLTLHADGYEDATVTVVAEAAPQPSEDNLPDAPSVAYQYSYYDLQFTDASTWLGKVSGVTVIDKDGKTKNYKLAESRNDIRSQKKYAVDSENNVLSLYFDKNYSAETNVTIVVYAEGYAAYAMQVTIPNSYSESPYTAKVKIPSGLETQPEETLLKPVAPAAVTYTSEFFGDSYYRVSFSGDAADYLKAIYNGATVTINGTPVVKTSSFWHDTNSFKVTSDSYGAYAYLDFTEDCFSGDNTYTVVIKADDYEPLTFTVQNGVLAADAN